jgi:hypothetical protein
LCQMLSMAEDDGMAHQPMDAEDASTTGHMSARKSRQRRSHKREAPLAGKLDKIPAAHASDVASVIHPTLCTGGEAMLAAAGAWLASGGVKH